MRKHVFFIGIAVMAIGWAIGIAGPPALDEGPDGGAAGLHWKEVATATFPVEEGAEWAAYWPETIQLPHNVRICSIRIVDDTVTVDFLPSVLSQLNEGLLTDLFDVVRRLFYDLPQVTRIEMTCKGQLLSTYLPVTEAVTAGDEERDNMMSLQSSDPMMAQTLTTTSLSGKKIALGPSHGRYWNGSGWYWQRGEPCGSGEALLEDTNSIRLMQFLTQYLEQDGATVYVARQMDESDCCHPAENRYWWHMAAYAWLRDQGYPCSVWGTNSGYCTSDTGPDRYSDDIRARPLFADYHGTDIYISHHTNAYNGSASGTVTFRDTQMEHPEHETNSYDLAQKLQSNICDVITNVYGVSDWYDRGVQDSAGGFGEIRIPDQPAALIELAFHDNCNRDALYLTDNWFRSLTMWSIYKGVCEYFGVTPTWDLYSCEYVSDTIPTAMDPEESRSVSITYRNRGVLWNSARDFMLGAVGDSDPFASFSRVNLSGETGPGETFTFTFTLTAPATPNVYTTEWQMVRDGIAWFGPIVSKQITVGTGPFPPTIVEHPTSLSLLAGETAVFTVEATGTEPLSYQWQKNGSNLSNGGNISGATTDTLTITNVQSSDAANYRCVVTNGQGSATSDAATLAVQSQQVVHIVESRSGGLNYANYSEIGSWGNSSAKSTAEGCTSGIGSRYSTIGSSDNRAIFTFTPSATGTYEVFTTNCNTSNSGDPLIHRVFHASGSSTVGVCQNSTCGINAINKWYSLGQYTLNDGVTYTVEKDARTTEGSGPSGNAARSDAIRWVAMTPSQDPPTITEHPSNQSVSAGATATFTVEATGTAPLSYQWQKNNSNISDGGDISGATTDTLQIANCESADEGNYRCVVTNAYGNATSNNASLTVTSGGGSEEFIVESRSGGQNYASYSEVGTWGNSSGKSTAEGCTSGIGSRYAYIGTTDRRAVYSFTPTVGGYYEVFTTNCYTSNSGNPLIHRVYHAGGTSNVGVCQNSTCGTNAINKWYSLGVFTLNQGTTYYVELDARTSVGSSPSGNAARSDAIRWVTTDPPAPDPVYIVESRSGGQNYANYSEIGSWNDSSSKSSAEGCTTGIGHRYGVIGTTDYRAVYSFTPQVTGTYEVFTTNCTTWNSGNPLVHRVYHAGGSSTVGVCQNADCNPNAVNNWYSLGQYTLNQGTTYDVVLDARTSAGSSPSGNAARSDAIKWEIQE